MPTLTLQGLYGELDRKALDDALPREDRPPARPTNTASCRQALDDDLLRGVSFCCADATREAVLRYTHSPRPPRRLAACSAPRHSPPALHRHIYAFDRVFSQYTLAALARLLQRSHFFVFVSSKAPRPPLGHLSATSRPPLGHI